MKASAPKCHPWKCGRKNHPIHGMCKCSLLDICTELSILTQCVVHAMRNLHYVEGIEQLLVKVRHWLAEHHNIKDDRSPQQLVVHIIDRLKGEWAPPSHPNQRTKIKQMQLEKQTGWNLACTCSPDVTVPNGPSTTWWKNGCGRYKRIMPILQCTNKRLRLQFVS